MFKHKSSDVSRRTFIRDAGLAAGGMLLAPCAAGAMDPRATAVLEKEAPRRILGKTKESVTTLAMGTCAAGLSRDVTVEDIATMVQVALDSGVRYFDTARRYGKAEEGVGRGLGSRRKEVFLTSKVAADTIADAEQSLSTSLKLLKTDCIDLVYFHNLGVRDMRRALEPDGVFPWLVKQKKAGKFRFLGISGHSHCERFRRFIETDEPDVLMCVLNFADRFTYGFEDKVLPLARKHNLGIVAMKVFGGIRPGDTMENLQGPRHPAAVDDELLELAVRYALGIPGVALVNIGVYRPEEVRKNAEMVRSYRPLSPEEQATLAELGQKTARRWGEHFGPPTGQSG